MSSSKLSAGRARECFLAALESTTQIVSAVDDDAWSRPTPCDEWDVKDVVNHLVYENLWAIELFSGRTIEEVGTKFDGDLVGGSPRERYAETSAEVSAIIEQPGSMDAICQISSGPVPGSEYASQLFVDALIHGWDIGVGSGQSVQLDSDLVAACMPLALATREAVGDEGPFGTTIKTRETVTDQTRLLAILGRDAVAWEG